MRHLLSRHSLAQSLTPRWLKNLWPQPGSAACSRNRRLQLSLRHRRRAPCLFRRPAFHHRPPYSPLLPTASWSRSTFRPYGRNGHPLLPINSLSFSCGSVASRMVRSLAFSVNASAATPTEQLLWQSFQQRQAQSSSVFASRFYAPNFDSICWLYDTVTTMRVSVRWRLRCVDVWGQRVVAPTPPDSGTNCQRQSISGLRSRCRSQSDSRSVGGQAWLSITLAPRELLALWARHCLQRGVRR